MAITVKYFAVLRERFGKSGDSVEFEDGMTVSDVWRRTMDGEEMPENLMIAVNMEYTRTDAPLQDGDEVAFFPPVSGGSGAAGGGKFTVTFDPISLDEMAARVVKPETGAVAVFGGVVRNVSGGKAVEHLEYEAYQEMAVGKLKQVAQEARQKWPKIVDIAIVQRIGHLEVGENAVVVAVSSPHRGDGCFEACAYAINRLKEIVPIWKKEVGPDGEAWIEGDYMPSTSDSSS